MKGSTSGELRTPAGHYTFVAPSPGRRIVTVTLWFTLLGLIYGVWLITTTGTDAAIVLSIVMAVLAVGQWTLLQARIPQRIDVEKSVITIHKSGRHERYDLVDPGLEIRVRDGEIAFAHYMKPWSVVRAKDVDWPVFLDVVMHYQSKADVNADLRDQRFRR